MSITQRSNYVTLRTTFSPSYIIGYVMKLIAHREVSKYMGEHKIVESEIGAFAVWISNEEIEEGHVLYEIRGRLLEIPTFPFLRLTYYFLEALEGGRILAGGSPERAVCSTKWFQISDKSLAVMPRQLMSVVYFCREVLTEMVRWDANRPSEDDLLSDTLRDSSMQKNLAELERRMQTLESVLKARVRKQHSSTRGSGPLMTLVGASTALASVVTDIPAATSTPVHTKPSSAKGTRDWSSYVSLMYPQSDGMSLSFRLRDLERSLKDFSIDVNSKTSLTRFWALELEKNGRQDDRREKSSVGTSLT